MQFSIATIVAFAAIVNAASIPQINHARAVDALSADESLNALDVAGNDAAEALGAEEFHFSGASTDGELVAATADNYEALEAMDTIEDGDIQKRVIGAAILATVGTQVLTDLTTRAINAAAAGIKNLSDWTKAREAFTQATTLDMWNKNNNKANFPAVACYNKGYKLKNANGKDGLVSVKLTSGLLNTNYDCMYVAKGNTFYTNSDGGYINLSYRYTTGACTFDQKTQDLTCK